MKNYKEELQSRHPGMIDRVNALRVKLGADAPQMSAAGQEVYGNTDALNSGAGLASMLQKTFERLSSGSGSDDRTPVPAPETLQAPRVITRTAPFPAASSSGMPGAPGGQLARKDRDILTDDGTAGPGSSNGKPVAPPSGSAKISPAARQNAKDGGIPGSGLVDQAISRFSVPAVASAAPQAPGGLPAPTPPAPTQPPMSSAPAGYPKFGAAADAGGDKQTGLLDILMEFFKSQQAGTPKQMTPDEMQQAQRMVQSLGR